LFANEPNVPDELRTRQNVVLLPAHRLRIGGDAERDGPVVVESEGLVFRPNALTPVPDTL